MKVENDVLAVLSAAKLDGSKLYLTGNGTSVVNALRRRGFNVTRNKTAGSYKLQASATGAAA